MTRVLAQFYFSPSINNTWRRLINNNHKRLLSLLFVGVVAVWNRYSVEITVNLCYFFHLFCVVEKECIAFVYNRVVNSQLFQCVKCNYYYWSLASIPVSGGLSSTDRYPFTPDHNDDNNNIFNVHVVKKNIYSILSERTMNTKKNTHTQRQLIIFMFTFHQ